MPKFLSETKRFLFVSDKLNTQHCGSNVNCSLYAFLV